MAHYNSGTGSLNMPLLLLFIILHIGNVQMNEKRIFLTRCKLTMNISYQNIIFFLVVIFLLASPVQLKYFFLSKN